MADNLDECNYICSKNHMKCLSVIYWKCSLLLPLLALWLLLVNANPHLVAPDIQTVRYAMAVDGPQAFLQGYKRKKIWQYHINI